MTVMLVQGLRVMGPGCDQANSASTRFRRLTTRFAALHTQDLVPPRIATHVRSAGSSEAHDSGDEASEAAGAGAADGADATPVSGATPAKIGAPEMDALHFFGVFDGHGA